MHRYKETGISFIHHHRLMDSQHQHRSYITVTAHFIIYTIDFKFSSRCLATKEVAEDHN